MSAAFVSKKDIERLSALNYCIKHKHLNNLFLRSYSGDFGNKSAIFPDILHGQRGSTKVKRVTVQSMCYSATTVPSHLLAAEGIWTPNQKLWGSPAYHLS